MFSKQLYVVFLSLALFANAFPQPEPRQAKCGPVSTVLRTVTVTGRAAPTAAPTKNGGNNNGNNGGNNEQNNGGNNNGNNGGNNGGNNNGNNNGNNGGNNNGGNNGGNNNGGNNNGGGNNNNGDPQTSFTLSPAVIADGFKNNGQDVPTAGQVPSLTSSNNFMNFCLTVNLPITNGKQIPTGSCNPAPIGVIPSVDNMPSSKFVFPKNFATIKAGETFTVEMAIQKMQTGFFVNAQANYFAAPQTLNNQGQIQGHSHVVIEKLDSLDQITPTDPKKFVFFKGLNEAARNGKLTAQVAGGLAAGVYKMSSINSSSNHQPVIVPVAQHGSLDDAVYFTVTADGNAGNGGNNQGQNQGGQNQNQGGQNQNQGGQNQNQGGQNQNQGGQNQNKGGQNQNQGGGNNRNRNFNRFRGGRNRRSYLDV